MRFETWCKRHGFSRQQIARAMRRSHTNLNRLANGQPPNLRGAAFIHHLSGGEIGYEDMLPTGFLRGEAGRIERARRELGLD